MSQREEEEEATSPGDSAAAAGPGDPIDIAPELSASVTHDNVVVEQSLSDEPINVSSGDEAVMLADSQVTEEAFFVSNGREEDAANNVSQDHGARADFELGIGERSGSKDATVDVAEDVEEEGFDPRIGERPNIKEAAMAEALINGLHHGEHGGVVGPTGVRDQHKIQVSGQHLELAQQPPDRGKAGSPLKGVDNGAEGGPRPGGAVDHHRKPPLSGSHSLRSTNG